MSLYSIPAKKHTAFYDNCLMPKVPVRDSSKDRKQAEIKEVRERQGREGEAEGETEGERDRQTDRESERETDR